MTSANIKVVDHSEDVFPLYVRVKSYRNSQNGKKIFAITLFPLNNNYANKPEPTHPPRVKEDLTNQRSR